MKRLLFFFLISSITLNHAIAAGSGENKTSWSALYGFAKNENEASYTPRGIAYKLIFGERIKNAELGFLIRFTNLKGDITYSNIEGNITHRDITGGVHFGYWIFSRFKIHAGYARHAIMESLTGNYSTTQASTINSQYKVANRDTYGLYGGTDLVLINSESFQFYVNYDYYHLNSLNAHDWEAMAGLRFYLGGSKASGEENLFIKFFNAVFSPSKK